MSGEMKAWVLRDWNRLEFCKVPIPTIEPDQVLLKIESACLCNGSDPGIYHGHEAYFPPLVFGHEACGIVTEVGAGVTDFHLGDRVSFWCCLGAFAEYQAVNPKEVAMFRVPENIPTEEAPVLELVIASCRALMEHPSTPNQKTLLVCGLGPSGLVLIQYARCLGYQYIIGWDLYESLRNLALTLGADQVFDPAGIDSHALSQMVLADVSVVMMGDDLLPGEPTGTQVLRATRPGGLVISYGHPEHGRRFSPYVFQARDLTMRGPVNNLDIIREKGRFVMEQVQKGKIQISPLITHRLHFSALGEAFQKLLQEPASQIKVIFTW